jgi:hypothetical protein
MFHYQIEGSSQTPRVGTKLMIEDCDLNRTFKEENGPSIPPPNTALHISVARSSVHNMRISRKSKAVMTLTQDELFRRGILLVPFSPLSCATGKQRLAFLGEFSFS